MKKGIIRPSSADGLAERFITLLQGQIPPMPTKMTERIIARVAQDRRSSTGPAERFAAFLQGQVPPMPTGLTERVVARVHQQRCVYCGGMCRGRDGEGTPVCSMEHLLLLRRGASPGSGSPPPTAAPAALRSRPAAGPLSGRYSMLSAGQSGVMSATPLLSTVRATRLRARTLCEDIDEGLSLAVEALRDGRVAIPALGRVSEALGEIAGYLGVPPTQLRARVAAAPAVSLVGALAVVPRLDCDLRAAVQGDRDAGRAARLQTLTMLRAVEAEMARRETNAPGGRILRRRSDPAGEELAEVYRADVSARRRRLGA
jgi:hypothetical protein